MTKNSQLLQPPVAADERAEMPISAPVAPPTLLQTPDHGPLYRPDWLQPRAFLIGVLSGFLICCLLGFVCTRNDPYTGVARFGQYLSPESFFCPTFMQLRARALRGLKADQILVLVGGNSILNGVGQPERFLWTRKLQKELGPKYLVVNEAFRAAIPLEAGFFVAESLLSGKHKFIFITDSSPACCGNSLGQPRYAYIYLDALHRGYLQKYRPRDEAVGGRVAEIPDDEWSSEELTEMTLGSKIDALLNFKDLWTTTAYHHLFTIWSFLTPDLCFVPRKCLSDNECLPSPVPARFGYIERNTQIVREFVETYFKPKNNQLIPVDDLWQIFRTQIRNAVVPELRPHMLVLLTRNCRFYTDKLTEQVQRAEDRAFDLSKQIWEEEGCHAAIVGGDYALEDFYDRCHIAPSGGAKLAVTTANEVRKIARKLGYER